MLRVATVDSAVVTDSSGFVDMIQHCRVATTYQVRITKADGTPMLRRKSVMVWVNPWNTHGMHGASVFVIGDSFLANQLTFMLRRMLLVEVSGYGVHHLVRPVGVAMNRDIADFKCEAL